MMIDKNYVMKKKGYLVTMALIKDCLSKDILYNVEIGFF